MNVTNPPPCVLFEDNHLLVVNKPPGWNTHAPNPFAGEGLYDWLRRREPRWASLAIVHRLDKDTSGLIVFAKTTLASQSLTRQFTERHIVKKYLLVTDRPVPPLPRTVCSNLVRLGNRYTSTHAPAAGAPAKTTFGLPPPAAASAPPLLTLEATPATGRTHQIRVHAAESGFPILGDPLYGGTPAARLHLHAAQLTLSHPESHRTLAFTAPVDWSTPPALALRRACIDAAGTDAFRLIHGAADGEPGCYLDRLGPFLLAQSEAAPAAARLSWIDAPRQHLEVRGVYLKVRLRQLRTAPPASIAPRHLDGEIAPPEFAVRENGLEFLVRLDEGYSTGLFLDQRDNRRRLLDNHVAARFPAFPDTPARCEVLNLFAYTCAFSVCAARARARTVSVDLSRRYLEWGQRNFAVNGLDRTGHAFLHGDVFDWLRRLARQSRRFQVVLLDPPTFSTSKSSGQFRAEHDLGRLIETALAVLAPNGTLLVSTNAARLSPDAFLAVIEAAVHRATRRVHQLEYCPQPPDFPVVRAEPAYLKTAWISVK